MSPLPSRSRVYPTSAMYRDKVGYIRLCVGRGRGWGSCDVAPRRLTARPPTPTLPHKGEGVTRGTASRLEPAPTRMFDQLSLQAHRLLGVDVRRKLLVAGRITVLAQDIGDQVRVSLVVELAGTVGRHLRLHEAEQRRHIAGIPVAGKRRALERRAAELAVVEPRAVTIETIVRVFRLAAVGLLLRERRRRLRGFLRGRRTLLAHGIDLLRGQALGARG